MKAKQLNKGIDQLMDEGVAQLFTLSLNNRKVIGTVGALQFDVIQYRLEHEYGAKCFTENLNVHKACWVEAEDENNEEFADFKRVKQKFLAKDIRKGAIGVSSRFCIFTANDDNKIPFVGNSFSSETLKSSPHLCRSHLFSIQ